MSHSISNPTESPVILITGGSRGIGAATAILAAERGYDVCLSFRQAEMAAQEVVSRIRGLGRKALAIQADVGSSPDVDRLWEQALGEFGRISALVNNAAVLETQMRLDQVDFARLSRLFSVNVFGSMMCAAHAVRHMSTKYGGVGGSIVNLSSSASRLGSPNEYIDYASTKGAIDTMTIGLAKEVSGEAIRVNAVRPGPIHTEIHSLGGEPDRIDRVKQSVPMKRGGTASEVAAAILWLLSDEASYTTATILDVTGGL